MADSGQAVNSFRKIFEHFFALSLSGPGQAGIRPFGPSEPADKQAKKPTSRVSKAIFVPNPRQNVSDDLSEYLDALLSPSNPESDTPNSVSQPKAG
jgi:hypothetical protein